MTPDRDGTGVDAAAVMDFAARVERVVARHAGAALAGFYVTGSVSRNDLHATSDVDLVAVVASEPAVDLAVDELANDLVAVAADCPVRGMELVCYRAADLRPPRHPLAYLLNVNAGPAMETHVSTGGDAAHWFLLDVAGTRETATAVAGPPFDTLVAEPARDDVVRALRDSVRWHLQSDARGVNAVLNGCRSLVFARTGEWLSKTEAAASLVDAGAAPSIVAEALELRRAGRARDLDGAAVRAFLEQVLQQLV